MNLKEIAISKLREADLLNEEISTLKKKEDDIRLQISNLKKSIEKENSHLIGKKAICSNNDDPSFRDIECVCSYVFCTESFDIAPKFSRKGKKVSVDVFDWL